MDWDLRLDRAPDLEVTEVIDGFVVHRRDQDRIHYLNPTAAFVLESCNGGLRAGELPDLVAAVFQLEHPPLDDVETCVTALLKEGLLVGSAVPTAD
jgi:Coenzyme PQQ synthesis protein D (PqqD)